MSMPAGILGILAVALPVSMAWKSPEAVGIAMIVVVVHSMMIMGFKIRRAAALEYRKFDEVQQRPDTGSSTGARRRER